MAIIDTPIQVQNFELIRDRIGEVLSDELANQASPPLLNDPDLAVDVFIERFIPFDKSDIPAINVMLNRGVYSNHNPLTNDGTYTYFIDIYTKAKSTTTERGDVKSVFALHRLLGLCRAILESPKYRTLGFLAPVISHTAVTDVSIAEPENRQDASNIIWGRLTFTVRVPEVSDYVTPVNVGGYNTSVRLDETDNGYVFSQAP